MDLKKNKKKRPLPTCDLKKDRENPAENAQEVAYPSQGGVRVGEGCCSIKSLSSMTVFKAH